MFEIKNQKEGFTFIELVLSILIVSVLALTVALVARSITAIATRGLSLKSLNAVGNDLVDSISTSISQSPATDFDTICETMYTQGDLSGAVFSPTSDYAKCKLDRARYFVFSERKAEMRIKTNPSDEPHEVQLSGVFCTGKFSYVWNTGYTLAKNSYTGDDMYVNSLGAAVTPAMVRYKVKDSAEVKERRDFRLLRFMDANRQACTSRFVSKAKYGDDNITSDDVYDFREIYFETEPVELIPQNDNDLALYNFYLAPPAQDTTTSNIFYSGSFVLATLHGGVNIFNVGDYCEVTGQNADLDYCAVNKFNFAMRAIGK